VTVVGSVSAEPRRRSGSGATSSDAATDLLRMEVRRAGGRGVGSPGRQSVSVAIGWGDEVRDLRRRLLSDLRLATDNDDSATGSEDEAQGSRTEEARATGD